MSEVIGLVGGLAQTAGSIYSASEQNKVATRAESEREKEYQDLKKKTDPASMMAGIQKIMQPLTAKQKQSIIQTIAGSMASQGQAGASGIIEEAVAEALSRTETERFSEAEKAYLQSIGIPLSALRGQTAVGGRSSPNVKGVFDAVAGLVKPGQRNTPEAAIPGFDYSTGQATGRTVADMYAFTPEVQPESVMQPQTAEDLNVMPSPESSQEGL